MGLEAVVIEKVIIVHSVDYRLDLLDSDGISKGLGVFLLKVVDRSGPVHEGEDKEHVPGDYQGLLGHALRIAKEVHLLPLLLDRDYIQKPDLWIFHGSTLAQM
jgi:hypothetical protein